MKEIVWVLYSSNPIFFDRQVKEIIASTTSAKQHLPSLERVLYCDSVFLPLAKSLISQGLIQKTRLIKNVFKGPHLLTKFQSLIDQFQTGNSFVFVDTDVRFLKHIPETMLYGSPLRFSRKSPEMAVTDLSKEYSNSGEIHRFWMERLGISLDFFVSTPVLAADFEKPFDFGKFIDCLQRILKMGELADLPTQIMIQNDEHLFTAAMLLTGLSRNKIESYVYPTGICAAGVSELMVHKHLRAKHGLENG